MVVEYRRRRRRKKKSIKTCYFNNPDVNSFLINIIKVDKCLPRPLSNFKPTRAKENVIPHACSYSGVKYELVHIRRQLSRTKSSCSMIVLTIRKENSCKLERETCTKRKKKKNIAKQLKDIDVYKTTKNKCDVILYVVQQTLFKTNCTNDNVYIPVQILSCFVPNRCHQPE